MHMPSAVLSLLVAACACAGAPSPAPPREPEPARARAALATVLVDNRSAESLIVSYRLTGRTSSEVGIGRVAARAVAELAPVPAGEPLILTARTSGGAGLTLPARTFAIDSAWVWLIPEDARFVRSDTIH
ncbi:MAG TPA: hypothetical protein VMN60_03645 [Longimicrobiales bacterium]|nr:hypothetical protein [Longimicrobiales bacterium]